MWRPHLHPVDRPWCVASKHGPPGWCVAHPPRLQSRPAKRCAVRAGAKVNPPHPRALLWLRIQEIGTLHPCTEPEVHGYRVMTVYETQIKASAT